MMSSVWLLPSTSTWPNKVLKGSSNYEQYLKRLYQKCHLLNFTTGQNVLEPSGHTLGSWLNMEGGRAILGESSNFVSARSCDQNEYWDLIKYSSHLLC